MIFSDTLNNFLIKKFFVLMKMDFGNHQILFKKSNLT